MICCNFFTQGPAYVLKKHILSMQVCGRLPFNQPLPQCVSEQSCSGLYLSRANEKAQMDFICTGINSIKIYLHQ